MVNKLFKLNIAVIVMLIEVVTCQNVYALRVPVGHHGRVEKILSHAQDKPIPKVAVIILHYGKENGYGEQDTLELLGSLGDLSYTNYEIILLDNNSPDNFFSKYKDILGYKFPSLSKITFIKSEVNLGFAEGNNLAMEYVLDDKADYFFLLNNDTVVNRDLLNKLVQASETSEVIGIVGPKIYKFYNPDTLDNVRGKFFGRAFKYEKINSGLHELDYVSGAAMLVKKGLLYKVGGMTKKAFYVWRGNGMGYEN